MNDRQRVFVEEYLKCWNSSEAARRAGYNGKSNVQGPRLLADDSIKAAIQARLAEIKMSADEVLTRLANMGRSNIADFAHVGSDRDLAELGDNGQVVRKFRRRITRTQAGGEYEEIELELYDAQAALVQLGKAHGLFTDKIEQSGELRIIIARDESPLTETTPETE